MQLKKIRMGLNTLLPIIGMLACVMGLWLLLSLYPFLRHDIVKTEGLVTVGISISLALVCLGVSFIAIGLSLSSEMRMKALTKLNFNEKMAMFEDYRGTFCSEDRFKTRLNRLGYDVEAESSLKHWADDDDLKKLMEIIIKIIKCAIDGDSMYGRYTEDICELIEIALQADPENKDLNNLINECPRYWRLKKGL